MGARRSRGPPRASVDPRARLSSAASARPARQKNRDPVARSVTSQRGGESVAIICPGGSIPGKAPPVFGRRR